MHRLQMPAMALAVLLFLLISPGGKLCASEPEENAGAEKRDFAIRIFSVKPKRGPAAIMLPAAGPPPPLDDETKREALTALNGDMEKKATGETASFVLDSETPYRAGQGYLILNRPRTVHPEAAIEFGPEGGAVLGVKLNVEEGGLYLLDFAVSATEQGFYRVSADTAEQTFEDPHARSRHLLIALRARADGWTTIRLQRPGSAYSLHQVEITRANPPL